MLRAGLPTDHLDRPRLTGLLDQGLERRLTLVSAPAGCGKTTLLSAWRPPDALIAWIPLDEGDDHLRDFVRRIIGAVQVVARSALQTTRSLLLLADQPAPAALAARLADELAELPHRLVIVLDDYHVIRDHAVHTFVGRFVALTGANTHLVISTREDPPLPTATLRARADLIEIGLDHLLFTPDETRTFLSAALPFEFDEAYIEQLTLQTDGWAAGLRLASLELSRAPAPHDDISELVAQGIQHAHAFIVEDILAAQAPPLQDLLLRSSILDRFCAPLLHALQDEAVPAGNMAVSAGAGEAWIEELERENLFIATVDASGVWHRLHALFREALHALLVAEASPELVATLHRRASDWFAERGMVEEAIHHALAAGDPGQTAHVIVEGLHALLEREEDPGRLERWIRLLPTQLVSADPAVVIARAWLLRLHSKPAELPDLLQRAETLLDEDVLRDEATRDALRGCIATLWPFYWSTRWDGERMLEHTTAAIKLLPRRWLVARGEAGFMHATALAILGREEDARRFFAACRDDSAPEETARLARVLTAEARMNFLKLHVRDTLRSANELLAMEQASRLTFTTVVGRLFAGLASYERNALDEARAHFETWEAGVFGLAPALYTDNALGLALTLHALGEDDAADDTLRRITAIAEDAGSYGALRLLRSFQARLALGRGDDDEAGRQLRLLREIQVGGGGYPSFIETPEVTQIRWLLRQGDEAALRDAEGIADQLRQLAAARGSVVSRVRAQIVGALLLQARGDTRAALAALREIVLVTRQGDAVRILADFGAPMQQLIAELMRTSVQPDPYLTGLLAVFPQSLEPLGAVAPSRRAGGATATEALSSREVEILALLGTHQSNKQISRSLGISAETVKKHTSAIYRKLGVTGRREAVVRGQTLGLLAAQRATAPR